MTKQEIIQELFVASPAMATFLSKDENLDNRELLDAICGAPISLERKLKLLRVCSTWDLGIINKEFDRNEECRERIKALELAIMQLEAKPGDVFLWRCCWYDRDWRETNMGRSAFAPSLSISDVFSAIDADEAFEYEGLTEKELAEGNGNWYEIQKWEQKIGEDGQLHLKETPWKYTVIDRKISYFKHCLFDEEHSRRDLGAFFEFENSSNLNLSIPFRVGDLISVDCRPFAPIEHAVLLEVDDNCCEVQIAYVDENKKLQTAALKHSHCFTDNYLSELSPLYRLALYEGELDENESALKWIQVDILKCKEEDRQVYCRGIWDAIQKLTDWKC